MKHNKIITQLLIDLSEKFKGQVNYYTNQEGHNVVIRYKKWHLIQKQILLKAKNTQDLIFNLRLSLIA